jgi:hypothetical protein
MKNNSGLDIRADVARKNTRKNKNISDAIQKIIEAKVHGVIESNQIN